VVLADLGEQRMRNRLPVITGQDHVGAVDGGLELGDPIGKSRRGRQPKLLNSGQFEVIRRDSTGNVAPKFLAFDTDTRWRFLLFNHVLPSVFMG
jgi:hypothetical protein